MAYEIARGINKLDAGVLDKKTKELKIETLELFFNAGALGLLQEKVGCAINEIDFNKSDAVVEQAFIWAGLQWLEEPPEFKDCGIYELDFKARQSLPLIISGLKMPKDEVESYLGDLEKNFKATVLMSPEALSQIVEIFKTLVTNSPELSKTMQSQGLDLDQEKPGD